MLRPVAVTRGKVKLPGPYICKVLEWLVLAGQADDISNLRHLLRVSASDVHQDDRAVTGWGLCQVVLVAVDVHKNVGPTKAGVVPWRECFNARPPGVCWEPEQHAQTPCP